MSDKVKVMIFEHEEFKDDFPVNLLEFRAWLDRMIERVPAEHREAARIVLDGCTEYGFGGESWSALKFKISFTRPKTQEEIEEEEQARADQQALLEQRERSLLAQLRAKYEPDYD